MRSSQRNERNERWFWEDWANCSRDGPTVYNDCHQEFLEIDSNDNRSGKIIAMYYPTAASPKARCYLFDLTLSTPNPKAGLWMIGWPIGTKTQGQDRILDSTYHAWVHLDVFICSPISFTAAAKSVLPLWDYRFFLRAVPAPFGPPPAWQISCRSVFLFFRIRISLYLSPWMIILTFFKSSDFKKKSYLKVVSC